MKEILRNNVSVGLSHKINAVSAQEITARELPEGKAFTIGLIMIVLFVLSFALLFAPDLKLFLINLLAK